MTGRVFLSAPGLAAILGNMPGDVLIDIDHDMGAFEIVRLKPKKQHALANGHSHAAALPAPKGKKGKKVAPAQKNKGGVRNAKGEGERIVRATLAADDRTAAQLMELTGLARGSISGVLDRLKKKGDVVKKQGPRGNQPIYSLIRTS